MSDKRMLPTAGYAIEKIYTNRLVLSVRSPVEGENGDMFFSWDWKFLNADLFEVSLGVKIEPSPNRREEVEAVFLGRFKKNADTPTVPLVDFAEQHAPGILMPYVRQVISTMTTQGFFGTFHIPPMNMREVIADLQVEATGRRQLAAGYGIKFLTLPAGARSADEIQPVAKKSARRLARAKSATPKG